MFYQCTCPASCANVSLDIWILIANNVKIDYSSSHCKGCQLDFLFAIWETKSFRFQTLFFISPPNITDPSGTTLAWLVIWGTLCYCFISYLIISRCFKRSQVAKIKMILCDFDVIYLDLFLCYVLYFKIISVTPIGIRQWFTNNSWIWI